MGEVNVNSLPPDQWYNPPPEELGEVDVEALRSNLRLTPDERLERLVRHNMFVRELLEAGERHRREAQHGAASA